MDLDSLHLLLLPNVGFQSKREMLQLHLNPVLPSLSTVACLARGETLGINSWDEFACPTPPITHSFATERKNKSKKHRVPYSHTSFALGGANDNGSRLCFNFTACGVPFLPLRLVWFFLSSKRKGTGKKRKKGICQFVDFLSCLLDRHPRGELGPRDKTRTGGCYKLGMGELSVWGVWEGSVPYSHMFGGSQYQTRNLLSGVRGC